MLHMVWHVPQKYVRGPKSSAVLLKLNVCPAQLLISLPQTLRHVHNYVHTFLVQLYTCNM